MCRQQTEKGKNGTRKEVKLNTASFLSVFYSGVCRTFQKIIIGKTIDTFTINKRDNMDRFVLPFKVELLLKRTIFCISEKTFRDVPDSFTLFQSVFSTHSEVKYKLR